MEAFRPSDNGPVDQDIGSLVDRLGHNKATRYRIIRSKPSVKLLRCIYVLQPYGCWSADRHLKRWTNKWRTENGQIHSVSDGFRPRFSPRYFKL